MNRNERSKLLEDMIDQVSLTTVLEMLSEVCYAKAEQLRTNQQDSTQALAWDQDAKRVDALSFKIWN
jgi:hypothetical protein